MSIITEKTRTDPIVTALLKRWSQSLPAFSDADFAHEVERTEYLPKSPAAVFMRTRLEAEGTRRRALRPSPADDHTVALMPLPPEGDQPQAGPRRTVGLREQVPAVYASVAKTFGGVQPDFPRNALGFDWWAKREQRWNAAGRVGDPSDTEYDDFFYQGR